MLKGKNSCINHTSFIDNCISIGQEIGGDHEEAKKKMNYPFNPIELE